MVRLPNGYWWDEWPVSFIYRVDWGEEGLVLYDIWSLEVPEDAEG